MSPKIHSDAPYAGEINAFYDKVEKIEKAIDGFTEESKKGVSLKMFLPAIGLTLFLVYIVYSNTLTGDSQITELRTNNSELRATMVQGFKQNDERYETVLREIKRVHERLDKMSNAK